MIRRSLKSKDAVAELLGYSRTQLYMVEAGDRPLTAKFLGALEREERKAGIVPQGEQNGTRPVSLEPYPAGRVFSDAEIVGLAALLTSNAAIINAGGTGSDVEAARKALETALQSRGALK